MKHVVATRAGLEMMEAPEPSPGPGQVVVDVETAGVGLVDLLMRRAIGDDVGFVPGIELAGTVSQIGSGVEPSLMGARVFAMLAAGGYAEKVAVDSGALVLLPEGLGAAAAVAIGVNALVANFALARSQVQAGERVLVRGASGGIGVMAVQLAAAAGAAVIASTRGDHTHELQALGAATIIDAEPPDDPDFDVIVDLVAGKAVEDFITRLKPNGRYVIAGIAGGMPPDTFGKALLAGFRRTISVSTFSLDTVPAASIQSAANRLFAMASKARLISVIERELPLQAADQAHEMLSAGGLFGKIILRVN